MRRNYAIAHYTSLAILLCGLVCGPGAPDSNAQSGAPRAPEVPPGQVLPRKDNITPGYKIIEGDMQVPITQSPGSTFQPNLWPGGVVYYNFDLNVTPERQEIARQAMRCLLYTSPSPRDS